jgi:DNA invertase Pin-like site-specific DNA recombinase
LSAPYVYDKIRPSDAVTAEGRLAMIIGYARVSTTDQNLDRQIDALNKHRVERIFEEKVTGTKANRPELLKMLDTLRSGDTLVVESFSRLSRSTKDLLELVDRITNTGVVLVSLKEALDTSTATGKLMLTMLAALSQFERDILAERTQEGLRAARARGRNGGRPKANKAAVERAIKLYNTKTMTIPEITEATGVSSATLYRYVNKAKV